ncbi:MAG: hypothetical protein NVSMB1_10800 [Polyangiales bacterium]
MLRSMAMRTSTKKQTLVSLLALIGCTGVGAIAASCSGAATSDGNANGGENDAGQADSDDSGNFLFDALDDGADGSVSDSLGSGGDSLGGDGPTPGSVDTTYKCVGCGDFPPAGAPACPPATLAAPTIAYPLDGSLLPPNMNVLEVQFRPPATATLFQVEFSNSITSVKVVTKCNAVPDVRLGPSKGCGVTLPQAAWNDVAFTNRDGDPVHVTVRATADGKCISASTDKVDLKFAKEDLAGGIYYWQAGTYGGIAGTTGGIYSHDFGTFDATPTPFYTSGATGTCVGCHNMSRDGARMALATDDPDADDEFGDVHTHVMDVGKRAVIGGSKMSPGFQTFTHDHSKMIASTWKQKNIGFDVFDGDGLKLLVSPTPPLAGGLKGTQPDLSKNDANLVFVVPGNLPGSSVTSISMRGDHHFVSGSIYSASFDNVSNAIGAPSALLLSSGTQNFYYPSFSPPGTFLVLNEASSQGAFYNRNARVKLLHFPSTAGAKPIDLPALNVADGLANSWPRWSPFVTTYKGKKLLWLTFSSNRDYGLHLINKGFDSCYPPESPTDAAYGATPQPASKKGVLYDGCAQPQIWMAGVVVDENPALDAGDRSFPAFWLPFQDVNSHNHSAQWVEKVLGTPPPPPPPPPPDAGVLPDAIVSTDAAPEAGPTCVPAGGGCTTALCCTDVVCCGTVCATSCIK